MFHITKLINEKHSLNEIRKKYKKLIHFKHQYILLFINVLCLIIL